MKKAPKPSRREAVALFRSRVIGGLHDRDLARGELQTELQERAKKRYRPPGHSQTRTYNWKTLQSWYYASKKDAVAGLLPQSRARGHAQALDAEQRELLLQMRMEHPTAAAEMLLGEAVRNGIVEQGALSVSTLCRLYRAEGLSRASRRRAARNALRQRRRWQAAKPGDLWHGDVCHVSLINEAGQTWRALVHGLLDDASRYCPALVARDQEREEDMLEVFCGALLRHSPPKALYLDNGACYRGDVLGVVCQRLGIRLVHATPHSPEARGTQERFWRTMRQRCTDHLPVTASLHDVNQALWAWLDADYHRRPHAGLMGETPRRRYLEGHDGQRGPLSPKELARALEIETTRRVLKDATFSHDGKLYEVTGRHLAGKRITIISDGLTGRLLRASWQGRPVRFGPCDPVANQRRGRPTTPEASKSGGATVPFDPITALLQKAREVGDE